jgi:hypothetical protein
MVQSQSVQLRITASRSIVIGEAAEQSNSPSLRKSPYPLAAEAGRAKECLRGVERRSNLQSVIRNQLGRQNQSLEQTRDNVLRHGESFGCELLNSIVLQ